MDQRDKDRIAAEIAADYRQTIRETAAEDARNQRSRYRATDSTKSIGVAYVLWFFAGGIGAHRFYLGYIASGVGMLLLSVFAVILGILPFLFVFSWPLLAVLTIWWLIDAFLIPRMLPDGPAY
jgi:TM2 domain-containing membrane protein YozV